MLFILTFFSLLLHSPSPLSSPLQLHSFTVPFIFLSPPRPSFIFIPIHFLARLLSSILPHTLPPFTVLLQLYFFSRSFVFVLYFSHRLFLLSSHDLCVTFLLSSRSWLVNGGGRGGGAEVIITVQSIAFISYVLDESISLGPSHCPPALRCSHR